MPRKVRHVSLNLRRRQRRVWTTLCAVLLALALVAAGAGAVITSRAAQDLLEHHGTTGLRLLGVTEDQVGLLRRIATDAPRKEPIAWWRAETGTQDAAGLYHGEDEPNPRVRPGLFGSAYSLDGYEGIELPMAIRPAGTFTLSAWVRFTGQAWPEYSPIMVFGDSSPSFGVNRLGRLDVIGAVSGETEIPIGEWTHVAYVWRGAEGTLYVNGRPSGTSELEPSRMGGVLRLGQEPGGAGWGGLIDEVRVYNRALSEEELWLEASYDSSGSVLVCPVIGAIRQMEAAPSPVATGGCEAVLFWKGPGTFEVVFTSPQVFDQVLVTLRPERSALVSVEVAASHDGEVWTALGKPSRTLGPESGELASPKSPPVRFSRLRLTIESADETPVAIQALRLAVPRNLVSG